MEVRVSKKYLEQVGAGSITGLIVTESVSKGDPFPSEVNLLFEQTSLAWRREHGGPDEIILTEYVPMCVAQDVALLCARGIKVTVGSYEE